MIGRPAYLLPTTMNKSFGCIAGFVQPILMKASGDISMSKACHLALVKVIAHL